MTRRTYVYTSGGRPLPEPYEVTDDWRNPGSESTGDLAKFAYDNLRATDGTDISSRTKHREYMKHNGLALADDFKQTWQQARAERDAYFRGEKLNPSYREAVGRAEYQLSKRRRK